MSTTRQYSRLLAVASNYKQVAHEDLDSVKSGVNYSVPTAYNGLEFAEFKQIQSHPDWDTFDLYGLTITAQVAPLADLVFTLWQRPSTDLSAIAEVTLGANNYFSQHVLNPVADGLLKANTYFIKCSSADPDAFAEGVELTYTIGRF